MIKQILFDARKQFIINGNGNNNENLTYLSLLFF